MKFTRVEIDCDRIVDWDSFHTVFVEAFGFPDFYGRNMNAWVDCMTSLDNPADRLTSVHAPEDGCLVLQLTNAKSLASRLPEQSAAIVECSAFVNWRRMEIGEAPVLMLSFGD